MNTSLFKSLLVGSLAALIAACGGGGGGGTLADVGIGGSGITSVGAVTAVGSITVNGVKFDTQGAAVTVDGVSGQESNLKVGLVTTITGTLNSDGVTGTATRVEVDNELTGTVDLVPAPTITATGGTFSVFGQLVLVDANTVFGNATGLADFPPGTAVEVSGFRDASAQVVRATRVEKTAVPATIEIKGTIITVNSASTFTLGTLTVNFANATRINFPAAGLTSGLLVEVKGPQPSAGVLTATSVEVRSDGLGQVSGEVRLEGIVNGFSAVSASDFRFTVNGQNVTTNINTAYNSGIAANLVNNIRVEVEGQISGGVLVATKVKFEDKNDDVKITAQVTSKSTTATNLTVSGAPGVPDVSVTTDISTIFQDNSSQQLRVFGFANIQVGDWLEIEAVTDSATNSVAATKVVRVNAPN